MDARKVRSSEFGVRSSEFGVRLRVSEGHTRRVTCYLSVAVSVSYASEFFPQDIPKYPRLSTSYPQPEFGIRKRTGSMLKITTLL